MNQQRQVGTNGPQPFSFSDIKALFDMKQIAEYRNVEDALELLTALDVVYLEDFYEKQRIEMSKRGKT